MTPAPDPAAPPRAKRAVPIVPTVIVVIAALLMVRLGVWQLDRRHEKVALLARYAANENRPPVGFAALWPVKPDDLFRRASVTCIGVTGWKTIAGHLPTGRTGWRHIAGCRTGAEGPGLLVDIGISASDAAPAWRGGRVAGRLSWGPTSESVLSRFVGPKVPPTPMIISEAPVADLRPSPAPDPTDVPNNHLAYAVQWFIFAALAVGMYAGALWQQRRRDTKL